MVRVMPAGIFVLIAAVIFLELSLVVIPYDVVASLTWVGEEPAVAALTVSVAGEPDTAIALIACTSYVTVCVAVLAAIAMPLRPKTRAPISVNRMLFFIS
jgi:hypothetical protein